MGHRHLTEILSEPGSDRTLRYSGFRIIRMPGLPISSTVTTAGHLSPVTATDSRETRTRFPHRPVAILYPPPLSCKQFRCAVRRTFV
ncbi:MAG: hypothetical protein GQF41_2578 [Candidatus Rifleibacterium amylolyticum]|nr:MAG: hypothetical protein GQF41_2578 [Candidatus Rifleibacterium amylolyticum]